MTRPHYTEYHCAACNTWQTQESAFGRWIRNNRELDSRQGIGALDQDYWIHRFKSYGQRDFQLLMGIEIKTKGAELSPSQRDTLHILNQFMRNRKRTPTKSLQYQPGSVVEVYSIINRRMVEAKFYGIHVLRFSGLGPDDSEWIEWDGKVIDASQLTKLIRFDLDPDTLRPLDLRNHHSRHRNQERLYEDVPE